MAIVTVAQLKEQLNLTGDLGTSDDALLGRKIAAAEDHIDRLLGFRIADRYGGEDQEPTPPALIEAVCQLAADWYENREASVTGTIVTPMPMSIWQIVNEYREYSFG